MVLVENLWQRCSINILRFSLGHAHSKLIKGGGHNIHNDISLCI